MKMKLLLLTPLVALLAAPAFGQVWAPVPSSNDFADFGNWLDETGNPPTTWAGDSSNNWIVDLAGANRAILGVATVTGLDRNLVIGDADSSTGALEINGGTLGINRNLRVGRGEGATGTVTMTSGTLDMGRSSYIGQSDAFGTFTLSGGTVNVNTSGRTPAQEEFGVAHQDDATGTLNISGSGVLNVLGVDALIADGDRANASVSIAGNGSLNVGRNARFGFGADSEVTLNMTGGVLDAANGFIGFGQGAGADVTFTMSGGEINADRMGFANNETAAATLNMTGGTINLLRTTGTASHAGGLRMQSAGAALNVGGDAVINTQKLYINDGGLLTLGGNALINVSGSDDGENYTFDFAVGLVPVFLGGGWDNVEGRIELASLGASIVVSGASETVDENTVNFLTLFNAAIANEVIFTDTAFAFDTGYNAVGDFTYVTLIPEPSTYALFAGMGALALVVFIRRRKP